MTLTPWKKKVDKSAAPRVAIFSRVAKVLTFVLYIQEFHYVYIFKSMWHTNVMIKERYWKGSIFLSTAILHDNNYL